MKIYIAGKINGDPEYAVKFEKAQKKFEEEGHVVLNPAILPSGMKPQDYMKICFTMIDAADEVHFLSDWVFSKGAQLEHSFCLYCGKAICFEVEATE